MLQMTLLGCLLASQSWAAADPLIGKWKLNPQKSIIPDEMKVDALGGNKYVFNFVPGFSETIVVDGTDQPGLNGTTLAVTAEGSDAWKVVRKLDGKTIITANWKLSPDGKTLTDHFTNLPPNGTPSTVDIAYKRTAGTSGFAGTWDSANQPIDVFEIQIEAYEGDGFSVINPSRGTTTRLKFDGQDHPGSGNVPAGFASAARRVNERAIDVQQKINGDVAYTQEFVLSPDRKTLNLTVRTKNDSKPKIYVFDRE
jgi:hypothetical protein